MLSVRGQFGGKYHANTVHNEGGSCFKSRQPGNLPEFGHGPCLPTSPWPILDRVATFWARLSLNVALFELRGQLLSDKLHRVDRACFRTALGVLPVSLCSYDLLLENRSLQKVQAHALALFCLFASSLCRPRLHARLECARVRG